MHFVGPLSQCGASMLCVSSVWYMSVQMLLIASTFAASMLTLKLRCQYSSLSKDCAITIGSAVALGAVQQPCVKLRLQKGNSNAGLSQQATGSNVCVHGAGCNP